MEAALSLEPNLAAAMAVKVEVCLLAFETGLGADRRREARECAHDALASALERNANLAPKYGHLLDRLTG